VTNENSTINKWNEWVRITSTKREALNAAKAKLGAKWSELAEVNAEKGKINTEKEAIEDGKNKAKKGRVSGLITQFKTLRDKAGKRSYRELLFMHNILGWIKKWEVLKTDATFDPAVELAKFVNAMGYTWGFFSASLHDWAPCD